MSSSKAVNKRIFNSVGEIVEANREAGQHFFDHITMRFFESVVEPEVYGPRGRLFIISDKAGFTDPTREFKIKWACGDGSIENVELHTFGDERVSSWASKPEAVEVLRGNLRYAMENGAQTLFDPYDADTESNSEHFQWLVGIGHLKVGVRTTVAECERLIEEGFKP